MIGVHGADGISAKPRTPPGYVGPSTHTDFADREKVPNGGEESRWEQQVGDFELGLVRRPSGPTGTDEDPRAFQGKIPVSERLALRATVLRRSSHTGIKMSKCRARAGCPCFPRAFVDKNLQCPVGTTSYSSTLPPSAGLLRGAGEVPPRKQKA